MFPKQKRIINRDLLDTYQGKPCAACGVTDGTVGHHIKTRGSGGDDIPENLVPLCVQHHTEIHLWGIRRMMEKYPRLVSYLGAYK